MSISGNFPAFSGICLPSAETTNILQKIPAISIGKF